MSATDQMRDMINELMGSDVSRQGDNVGRPSFDDYRVCRPFLLGCCVHDILASTRMDMGECPKVHEVALRADYDRAQKEKDYFFEMDAYDILDRFFYETDRKMELAKKKLAETQEELSQDTAEKAEAVLILNEKIGKTLAEAEKLGNEGQVEESMKVMEQLEALKKEKQEADNEYRNAMPASSYQQQKLRVCDVCGAYLGIHDNDRRLADHFGGKLHVGFVFLREKLADLKVAVNERKPPRNRKSEDAKSTASSRDARPERRRSRSPRDRDRGRRDKDKDKDRKDDRDRDRRSKDDREERKRDKDRDRKRSSRKEENSRKGTDSEKKERVKRTSTGSKHSKQRQQSDGECSSEEIRSENGNKGNHQETRFSDIDD